MTGYSRHIFTKIAYLLELFPAVGVLGVRQSGKTTLCHAVGPHWRYIDLENEHDFEQLSADSLFFFHQYPSQIILDEAQQCPPLFNTLRGVIDQHRSQKGRFLITGSSQPELISHITESLAGRIAYVELSPFSLLETGTKPMLERHWFRGGFPSAYSPRQAVSAKQWLDFFIEEARPRYRHWLRGGRGFDQLFGYLAKYRHQHQIEKLFYKTKQYQLEHKSSNA
jgi:predicted AAA+ superfamily ATPase